MWLPQTQFDRSQEARNCPALAARPQLLLLMRSLRVNPSETEEALGLMRKIKELGITLMIVEHVIQGDLGFSSIIVLSSGTKIFDGLPQDRSTIGR